MDVIYKPIVPVLVITFYTTITYSFKTPTSFVRSRPTSVAPDQLPSLPTSFDRYRSASLVTDQLHTLPTSFTRHRPAPLVTIQLRSLPFSYRIARYQPSHDIQQLFYNIERTEIKIIIFWNSKIYWIKFAEFSLNYCYPFHCYPFSCVP